MKVVLAALAVVTAAGAMPAAADHAGAPTVIKDVAGDANYVNDGGEFGSGDTATPTSDPGLDLLDVTLRALRGVRGEATGFTVVMTTVAPLRARAQVTLKTRTPSCSDILLQYVHSATSSTALLSSGCSPGTVPVRATVDATRLTIVVPFTAMPDKTRKDKQLTTVNAYTQLNLATEPFRNRPVGVLSADTTLASRTYRLR